MVDISTRYLGLEVPSPFVASASPLSERISGVRELEDAGLGAIVLYSLFEEQVTMAPEALHRLMGEGAGGYAEAVALISEAPRAQRGPLEYLEHVRAAKQAVDIPVIASVNGTPGGGWHHLARLLQDAGADAVELNLYNVPTDPRVSAADLEAMYFHTVRQIAEDIDIPLSVKLHPFFTSLPHAAQAFYAAGARGLVLFNRFYQPDLDLEGEKARSRLHLSTSAELRLPLRWVSIMSGQVDAELAVTGGVHTAEDALKALALGAQVTMVCSTLLRHGVSHATTLNQRLRVWLEAHNHRAIDAFRGSMSSDADVRAVVQRAQYMRNLQDYDMHP